jgi:predicted AlkP superfamily pyrophosphatase or phosphodiesterase
LFVFINTLILQIKKCDEDLGYLIKLLKEENIYDDLNIILVGDHGMAQMITRGTLLIQSYTNRSYVNSTRTVYGVTTNLYPIDGYVRLAYLFLNYA